MSDYFKIKEGLKIGDVQTSQSADILVLGANNEVGKTNSIPTSSIQNFDTAVSASAVLAGFGSGGGGSNVSTIELTANESFTSGSIGAIIGSNLVRKASYLTEADGARMLVVAQTDISSGSTGTFITFGDTGNIYANLETASIVYMFNNGNITQTEPNTDNTIYRVIGYATTTSSMFFNPSTEWMYISSGSIVELSSGSVYNVALSGSNIISSSDQLIALGFNTGSGGGGLSAATWQTVSASVAGVASVDFSSGEWVYVNGDTSWNLTILDTGSLIDGYTHTLVSDNTSGSQIQITNGFGDVVSNLMNPFPINTDEYLRMQIFKDVNGKVHFVGGVT